MMPIAQRRAAMGMVIAAVVLEDVRALLVLGDARVLPQ